MGKFDEIWKETIEKLFEQFIYFYMPDLAVDVDFQKGYTFLDKEFQTIALKSKDTKRFMDKLIKVYLKNGQEHWILIHLEVQLGGYKDFAKRMFRYFYRIYDKYNRNIVSLAIFTGKSKTYPLSFNYDFYKTRIIHEYRCVKLADYEEDYLLNQDNIFALVTLAVNYSIKSKSDEELRYKFKSRLIRLMFSRGYSEEEIIDLFRFIEIMLEIKNENLNKLIYEEILKYQKEVNKMVVTKFEKIAMEKGKEAGIKKGMEKGRKGEKIEIAKELLIRGFSIEDISGITKLSLNEIKKIRIKDE